MYAFKLVFMKKIAMDPAMADVPDAGCATEIIIFFLQIFADLNY